MATMTKNKEITIFPSANDLFQFAANDFAHRAVAGVNDKGTFSVVLAGGNTPKLFFDTLTGVEYHKYSIPWCQIRFFFGDERYVPSDDAASNYRMAYEHLFSKVPVNPENVYRIPTEFKDPKEAAKDYEQTLRRAFHIKDNTFPQFDLLYLGLGDNAHTASLMPLSDIVMHYLENPSSDKNNQLVTSLFVSKSNKYRITLTPNAINNAMDIIFLVTGANKATAVWEVLEGQTDPLHYPAQLIHSIHRKTIWYLDQAAAGKLRLTST
ncbi:MAG: 6-phosphogluconolactonase [Gammaproteobacteria bacterium]